MNNVELLDVTIQDTVTGLQLNLTSFHFDGFPSDSTEREPEEEAFMSFFNAKLSWNVIKNSSRAFMGPYAFIDWNPFDWDADLPFEAGCDLTLFMSEMDEDVFPFRCKVATLNAGCRFREGQPYFMAGISVDLAGFLYTCLMSEYYEVSGE